MSILIILIRTEDLNNGDAAANKSKFEIARDGKKRFSEYVYIARAYMNADNQILKLLFKR
jgi:hypothetical protein